MPLFWQDQKPIFWLVAMGPCGNFGLTPFKSPPRDNTIKVFLRPQAYDGSAAQTPTSGVKMAKFKRTIGLLSILTLGAALPASSGAAAEVKAKVGDCLRYATADVFVPTAKATFVKCSGQHNAEIYRISKFKAGQNVPEIDPLGLSQVAQSFCFPWKGNSKFFDQWTFRIPTNAQWKTGSRWIRCEALKNGETPDENGQLTVVLFRGKKLDFK